MSLKCKIGRNYKGMPIGLDSSGQESLLFLEARNELYEDGLSEIQANNKAFEIWATASSEEFQELTGKNEDTATYADYKAFARTLTKPAELNEREQYELSEVMRSYGYESLSEFKRQLDRIFRAEGKYSIETSEALISGLYTLQSLNDVDVSKVISLMNKIDRQLELGNDIFVEPFESYAVYQGDSFASPTLGIVKKQTLKDIEDIIKERAQSFTEEEIRAAVRELDNTEFIRKFEGNETFAKEFIDGFKGLRKIPVQTIGLEGLEPVSKRKTTIRNTFPASVNLTPITARADYFRNIPEAVWNNSQEEIEKLLSKTEEIAAEQGIDIIGLRGLQKQEVVEVLDAIAEAVETKNPDALATVLDNLLPEPAYTKIQRFDENFTPQTLINVDTNLSNEELFNSYGLIPLGNNVYQKVDTNESMQDLYEALADMVSENQIVIPEVHQTGDVLSDLERWLKTRDTGYGYKNTMASAFQLLFEHPAPESQDTSSVSEVLDTDYLTQRFPLDFYKAILKQKLAGINVYDKAFTITSRDITLDDQTVPTEGIPLMEQLVEYATISKNPEIRMFARTADESDPVIDAINNKEQVKEFANDFVGRGDQIVTAKNSAPVIKVNDILYAKGRDLGDISVYSRIEYQEDNTHYTTKYSVSPQEISLQELSDISARLLETDQGPNDSINKSGLASPFMQHLKETAKRIRETPREDQDTPRFMILGERGAQALDQAEESTRRLDNLAVARKMEEAGRTPLEIRVATEWERGADGLFRYEVGDLILKEELPQEGQEEDLIVADFIRGGDLIEAFPEILDITIRIVDYNEVEYEAMYSRQEDTIFLANYLIDEDARGMLLRKLSHELQHVVQEKEGFTIEGRKEIEEATPMGKLNLKSPYSDIKDGSFDLVTDLFEDFEREGYKLATDPPLIEGTNYYKILKSFAKDVANRLSKPIEEVRVLDRNTFEVTGFQRAYNYLRQDDELEVPATKEGIIESLDSDTEDFKVRNAVQGKTLQEIKEDFEKEQDEDRKYDLEKVIEILETREGIKKQVQNGEYKASVKVSSTATISNFLRNLPGDFPLESVYNYIVDLNEESEDTARNIYTVAASEVEARNVEERTEMSPQERRNTLLQETEDVAREDQIVLLEGFSAQSIQTQQESIGSPILQQLINQLSKLNTATKTSIVSPQQLSLYLKERGISDKVAEQVTNKEEDPAVSTVLEAKGLRLTPQGLYNPTTREILINQEAVDPINTTIHEFAHSFFHVVREKRRDVYEAGLSLVTKNQKEAQPYIDLVKATQPNLVEGTQEFLEEVLTAVLGDNGSRLVKQKTKGSIKTWISDLWNAVKEIFGLSTYTAEQVSNMTIQEFSDAVLKDMFSGQDINELFTGPQGEDNFNKWKGSNTLFEKGEIQNIRTGDPVVVKVYHGTTNEFYEFDSRVKGNIEGHLGKVNYFTSDYQDASNNYLSEGADITGRIDRRQDELEDTLRYEYQDSDEGLDFQQIIDDFNITDSEVEDLYPSGKPAFIQAEEISRFLAERELKGDTEKVLELYVKLNNPVVIGNGNSYVDLTDRGQFEEYIKDAVQEIADEYGISTEEAKEDYSWDIDNRAMEMAGYENPLYQALEQAISDNTYDYDNAPEKVSKVLSDFYESEVNLSQLETRIREELSYEQNEEGEITSSQIVADFFQNLGFDGVILTDVSRRFRNMGLGGNTSHIHVFDEYSNQIKLADGSNVTFGTTKDIRFSVQPQAPLDVTSNQFIHDANFELLIEPDGRLQDKYDACG
jgi:hypothetical protein